MLTGQRDSDLLILEKLDTKDLLNVCLINKYANQLCSIEFFWRNRFIKEYGQEFMKYKSDKKTWKKFYLQIVKYNNQSINFDVAMGFAAEENQKDVVDFFIAKGGDNVEWGMKSAAKGGHRDLVDYFIKKEAKNWDLAMGGAARGGHKDLVDFFISKGADDWQEGLLNARRGGHYNLVRFFERKINPPTVITLM